MLFALLLEFSRNSIMTTSTGSAPTLDNERDVLNAQLELAKSCECEFRQEDLPKACARRCFPEDILLEAASVKSELQYVSRILRGMSKSFLKADALVARLTGNRGDVLFRSRGNDTLAGRLFNTLITLCGYAFFKTSLSSLYYYATQDRETLISAATKSGASSPHSQMIAEIAGSGLFDVHYYLAQAPEAVKHAGGPVAHYIEAGREISPHRLFDVDHFFAVNEGLTPSPGVPPLLQYIRSTGVESYSPHPLFDASFYLSGNPDFRPVVTEINPLIHYLQTGRKQGLNPHPLFFNGYYMNRYRDQVNASGLSPLEHFVVWGFTGKFSPNEVFDSEFYLNQCPELKATFTNPLLHYQYAPEGVRAVPHPLFDAVFYLQQVSDQECARSNPLAHFLHSEAGKTSSPHPLFDVKFYLEEHPDVAEERYHAFLHFLRVGEAAGFNPNKFFFTRWYKERHSKIFSSQINSLEYYVKQPVHERSTPHPFFDPGYYRQNQGLQDSSIDPLIHFLQHGQPNGALPCLQPVFGIAENESNPLVNTEMDVAFTKLLDLVREPFSCLFLLPGLVKGGAERAACNYIEYLQELHGKNQVLVLSTYYDDHTCMDWLPEGSRFVDLVPISKSISWTDRGILVAGLVIAKRPEKTHMVNSFNFMHAMLHYRELLERSSRYVIYMFGYDAYLADGPAPMTMKLISKTVNWVDCLITDTQKLIDLVTEHFPDRIQSGRVSECCYTASQALDQILAMGSAPPKPGNRDVLWASRLVETKRPDLLVDVARKLPHLQFIVYGSAETGRESDTNEYLEKFEETPNIKYCGAYSSFAEIDKTGIGLFFYTSSSDGIPIVLLEAAASALPIIAPNVGGIPEFLSHETGWLVERFDDVETYCRNIEECLLNSRIAAERALRAQLLVKSRHSQSAVRQRLEQLKESF